MPRRDHLTILVDTLRELAIAERESESVSLTRLAARVNVPYDRFQANVRELQARELVGADRPWAPTPKGVDLLQRLDAWRAAVRDAGLGAPHEA